MTNEEIKTPEATPETSSAPETPAEPAAPEAPAAAPANQAPAPAATPVRAPITDPRKYFLLSNIFRAITVGLMVICTILSLYLPVFTINAEDDEDSVSFSVMDVLTDLPDEIKLCYLLDVLDPDDWEDIAEIEENKGDFSLAIDATILNSASAIFDEETPKWVRDTLKDFIESRGLIIIPYFVLVFPLIMVIGLAINTLVRLIQCIIGFIKPSSQIKRTDASACIVVTVLLAVCALINYLYSCFAVSVVSIVILAVVSIAAVVMNTIYRKHTKEIVDAQFSL